MYNGEYYFLTKLEVLDVTQARYKYQLDYDVVINFMARGVNVTGTLTKTNRPDILEECLQTTIPILSDPIHRQSYSKQNQTKDKVSPKLLLPRIDSIFALHKFKDLGVLEETFNKFIYDVENNKYANRLSGKE